MKTLLLSLFFFAASYIQAQWFVQIPIVEGGYNYQVNIEIESVTSLEKDCDGWFPPFTPPEYRIALSYNIWLTGTKKPAPGLFSPWWHYISITASCDKDFTFSKSGYPVTSSTQIGMAGPFTSTSYNCATATLATFGCTQPEFSVEYYLPGQNFWLYYPPVEVPSGFPLPIELLSFEAQEVNWGQVQLTWSTATETNNDFFTVERSQDLQVWERIGEVAGAGNSNTGLNYSLSDPAPAGGLNYYRLKQTDFNGDFSYSEVVAAEVEIPAQPILYPNPAKEAIFIKGTFPQNTTLEILDFSGITVLRKNAIQPGERLSLDLPSGLYRTILRTPDGKLILSENLYIAH